MTTYRARRMLRHLLIPLLLVPAAGHASERYLDRYFHDIELAAPDEMIAFRLVEKDLSGRDYLPASERLAKLIDGLDVDATDPIVRAQLIADAAMVMAVNGEFEASLAGLDQAISLIEQAKGPFDPMLADILLTRGMIDKDTGQYAQAIDSLRRAQHIRHRQDGVYTKLQLPIIDELANVDVALDRLDDADREHHFNLMISEQTYKQNN
ncbi:MAG: tetratricopeptide repeat protein, partial [Pseudomonadales bacterium]|nr:tetratricopeptide repeat protein [Pseudomonadales bacterium]